MKNKMSKNEVLGKAGQLSFLFLAFAITSLAQQNQPPAKAPEYKIPPEAAAKANPVKPTADSLAKGKKLYGYDCAMCHGKNGDGKGDMASDIKNVTDCLLYTSRCV